jgi:RNA polymerase sigma-70 factor (ECF subfamily)
LWSRLGGVELEPVGRVWIEPLVNALAGPAFQFAMALTGESETAQDIVQEAYLRVWESKRTPRELQSFRRWLYKTILNLARDHHRQRLRWARIRFWNSPPPDLAFGAEQSIGDVAVANALRTLSVREREAIHLRYFEDEAYEEVASVMRVSESTARVLVHRALTKLRDRLAAGELAFKRSKEPGT